MTKCAFVEKTLSLSGIVARESFRFRETELGLLLVYRGSRIGPIEGRSTFMPRLAYYTVCYRRCCLFDVGLTNRFVALADK